MKPVAVLYATREGHTRRVAEHVAAALERRGLASVLHDLRKEPLADNLDRFAAVVLASPVHIGQHAPEVVDFVKRHRAALERVPNAFVSLTLSEAGVERRDATPDEHAKFVADVQKVNDRFFTTTGWRPSHVQNVAGALLYTRYGFFLRLLMKRIASKSGGSTDTKHDHIYTDWEALDRFSAAFAESVAQRGEGEYSPVQDR
jgi:menaquinone-dependent protoporphyrinogen oxidase